MRLLEFIKHLKLCWDNPLAVSISNVSLRFKYLHLLGKYAWLNSNYNELRGKYMSLKNQVVK